MKNATLHQAWVLAKASYKEIIRDRLLYGIILVASLAMAASFFLGSISLQQDSRVIQNTGFAAIQLFTTFICIFVTTTSVHRDFDRRALYLLLPKPISRTHYILGKFGGMLLLLFTTLIILGVLFAAGVILTDHSILGTIPIVLAFSFLEISLLIGFALLFASFTAPLNAALYTIALYFIGHSLGFIRQYVARYGPVWEQHLIDAVYYVFPNLQKFDIRQSMLYHISLSGEQVFWALFYWLIYTGAVLALTSVVMKKREI